MAVESTMRVDDGGGAVLTTEEEEEATGRFGAQISSPSTKRCFLTVLVALRGAALRVFAVEGEAEAEAETGAEDVVLDEERT